jgi:hypothetical protein
MIADCHGTQDTNKSQVEELTDLFVLDDFPDLNTDGAFFDDFGDVRRRRKRHAQTVSRRRRWSRVTPRRLFRRQQRRELFQNCRRCYKTLFLLH